MVGISDQLQKSRGIGPGFDAVRRGIRGHEESSAAMPRPVSRPPHGGPFLDAPPGTGPDGVRSQGRADRSAGAAARPGAAAVLDAAFVLPLVLVLVCGVVSVLAYEPRFWVDLVYDDSYYYLGIARGLVENRASWFLPPFQTNGYQPLWQAILWLSAALFGTGDAALVLQAFCLNAGFALLFCWVSRRSYGRAAPAALATLLFTWVTLFGMETALLPALAVGYFTARDWRWRGALAALIFLTRLDALALVVAVDIVDALARRPAVRHYAVLVPVVALYAGLNIALFGVPVPVSGLMKAVGGVRGANLGVVLAFAAQLKYALIVAGIAVLAALLGGVRPKLAHLREIAALLLAQAVVALYYGLNSAWQVWPWYYWPAMLVAFYALLELADVLSAAHARLGSVLNPRLLLPLLVCGVLVTRPTEFVFARASMALGPRGGDTTESFGAQNVALVEALKAQKVPAGTFFAMGDRAGSFGFFLGNAYRFLHTEGLVGPAAYYRAMKDDQGLAFVDAQPIRYLVTDRSRYLEAGDVVGVIEPVQGVSTQSGPYLLCFPKSAIVSQRDYALGRRYVFEFGRHTACAAAMQAEFEALRTRPGAVRRFSNAY